MLCKDGTVKEGPIRGDVNVVYSNDSDKSTATAKATNKEDTGAFEMEGDCQTMCSYTALIPYQGLKQVMS